MPSSSASSAPTSVQEYTIRVPKNTKKSHHVMRFNATLNVDFCRWKTARMERENNMRDARMEEEMPKFGAGSEYNRDMREEARRKKFGITMKKYRPEAQPWLLKVDGKNGKKFRGIREGGIGENAAFYVFTHAPDGAIDAYPLNEWYNFQPVHRYKSLSAEEAEAEFGRRNKTMNYFSLMFRKRLRGDDDESLDPEEAKLNKISGKRGKELKISDMDEWIDSDDESNSSGGEDGEGKKRKNDDSDDDDKKKKKKKKNAPAKKKERNLDASASEESDDGDFEGRELEYISGEFTNLIQYEYFLLYSCFIVDSSEPESDEEGKANKEMKSVAEEDALRKLLTSEEESEDENKSESDKEDEEKNKKEQNEKESKDKKKKKLTKKRSDEKKESLSDLSSDSSDSSIDEKPMKLKKPNLGSRPGSRSESPSLAHLEGSTSSNPNKRKMASLPTDLGSGGNSNGGASMGGSENSNSPTVTPAKKAKYDAPALPTTFAGVVSGNKEYVRFIYIRFVCKFIHYSFFLLAVIAVLPKKLCVAI